MKNNLKSIMRTGKNSRALIVPSRPRGGVERGVYAASTFKPTDASGSNAMLREPATLKRTKVRTPHLVSGICLCALCVSVAKIIKKGPK